MSIWEIIDTYYIAYFCGGATMWCIGTWIDIKNKQLAKKKRKAEAASELKA
jgi:hypothetical protein